MGYRVTISDLELNCIVGGLLENRGICLGNSPGSPAVWDKCVFTAFVFLRTGFNCDLVGYDNVPKLKPWLAKVRAVRFPSKVTAKVFSCSNTKEE